VSDLFEEVEEQLRSDRYRQFAQTALPWLVGLAVLALVATLGYWGWDSWKNKQIDQASEQYAEALESMANGDPAKARTLWTTVSKSQAGGYKALSLMHLAAFAGEEKKTAEEVKLLDEAAKAAPDAVIGDAARLKSAFALLDTAPLAELEGRLKPLMEEGHPYRVQAREALAFAKLKAGDLKSARSDFVLLSQSLDAPDSVQSRANAALGLIDSGSAKSVAAVVKAADALPPRPTMDPAMLLPPGPQGQPQANPPQ